MEKRIEISDKERRSLARFLKEKNDNVIRDDLSQLVVYVIKDIPIAIVGKFGGSLRQGHKYHYSAIGREKDIIIFEEELKQYHRRK